MVRRSDILYNMVAKMRAPTFIVLGLMLLLRLDITDARIIGPGLPATPLAGPPPTPLAGPLPAPLARPSAAPLAAGTPPTPDPAPAAVTIGEIEIQDTSGQNITAQCQSQDTQLAPYTWSNGDSYVITFVARPDGSTIWGCAFSLDEEPTSGPPGYTIALTASFIVWDSHTPVRAVWAAGGEQDGFSLYDPTENVSTHYYDWTGSPSR